MRIVVLSGGDSAEREISLESGASVVAALRSRGHTVTCFDPSVIPVERLSADTFDIAIPMVHGAGGEDGTLQRKLLTAGISWVGSSPEASELTFNKHRTNTFLRERRFDVPDGVLVSNADSLNALAHQTQDLGPAVVTKPLCQGSSIGVSIVRHRKDLGSAVQKTFEFGGHCLIERFIEGREVTVAVVDGQPLPSIEIKPREWYDFDSKYRDEETGYVFESEHDSENHGDLAVRVCEACGVTGIARVDMRIDADGRAWVLEINTIPGMTTHSLVPKAAMKHGYSLGELLESSIETAMVRAL